MLELAGVRVSVILEVGANRNAVIFYNKRANLSERCVAFGVCTEENIENPLGLEDDGEAIGVTGAALLVGGSLDDSEERLACEAEAPFCVVDDLGDMGWPELPIELRETVEEFPKGAIVLLHRARSVSLLGEQDEGGVRAQ